MLEIVFKELVHWWTPTRTFLLVEKRNYLPSVELSISWQKRPA